jgi:thiol:disulfide interchange protein DsbD
VPVTVKQADKDATLTVTWQGCADAGFCYPPETKVIPLSAVLAASNDARQPPSSPCRRRASSGVQPAAAG